MKTNTFFSSVMKVIYAHSLPIILLITYYLSLITPSYGQIAINNSASNPDASAILDLNTGNSGVYKGFLAPQVALVNVTSPAPVTSPATGLLVYNTNASIIGGYGTGFYYWNSTSWIGFNNIGGSGINNYVARWTPNGNILGPGLIQDNNTGVGINAAPLTNVMLYANSTNGQAIYANSSTAAGDSATGATYGGFFSASNGTGISGTGNTYGGNFVASSGIGVYGRGTEYGVEGYNTEQGKIGVYGYSTNTTTGYGVYGYSAATATPSAGVYGESDNTQGVFGYSVNGYGVYGQGSYGGFFYGVNYGGYFTASGSSGNDVYGGGPLAIGHIENRGEGVYGEGVTTGIVGYSDTTAGDSRGGYFSNNCGAGFNATVAFYYNGTEYKIYGGGTVSTHVKDNNNVDRIMNCPEAPEVLFEDYGEGQLVKGKAHIDLDPILAKNVAINEKHPLRVFIELLGDCNGTYVTNRSASGFDVVELKNGQSNTAFQWHIICNRADEYDNNGKLISKNADNRFVAGPKNDENSTAKMQTPVRPRILAAPVKSASTPHPQDNKIGN